MPPLNIRIIAEDDDGRELVVDVGRELVSHFQSEKVSVSLKYFQERTECWSDWPKKDLKALTKTIRLLREQTADEVKSGGANGTPKCRHHKGSPKAAGFTRPNDVAEDIAFHELGIGGKARIHGFFVESVFFLVWLDYNHRAFP